MKASDSTISMLALFILIGLFGCEEEGRFEEVGEEIDSAVESAVDSIEEAVDELEEEQ